MSANATDVIAAGGPGTPARAARAASRGNARRYLLDRFAGRFVSLSGAAIIAAILAILVVIVGVAWPLVRPPRAEALAPTPLATGTPPLAVSVEEYRERAVVAFADGLHVLPLAGGRASAAPDLAPPDGASVVSAIAPTRGPWLLGLSDGRVLPVDVSFESRFEAGKRLLEPRLAAALPIPLFESKAPVAMFRGVVTGEGPVLAGLTGARDVTILRVKETAALVGASTREETRRRLAVPLPADATALALDIRADDLFLGLETGDLSRVSLRDPDAPVLEETLVATSRPGSRITALAFLNGDRTLVVGDAAGGVSTWQVLRPEGGNRKLTLLHRFEPHAGAVTAISPSRRDKGFVTADESGSVAVRYGTTGRTLLSLAGGKGRVASVFFAPKADGVVAAGEDGFLRHWNVHNPHPEVTLGSLFGKVWYEGYDKPEYVWQSTGGTDDFEAKFSLTPLLYGTLKGTFYALLVAVPLALLGALYTAQFMHPDLKSIVKPAVELMAALPSVVLGFIAGLWLAPAVERIVPGIAVAAIVLPSFVLLASRLWERLPAAARVRVRAGSELLLLVPIVLLAFWVSLKIGGWIEAGLLQGDYRTWLARALGVTYDQRNSLVVGLAMGFAVIPIIFTVAEDSIASVPPGLTAGSLALGATRWQTAIRTVLPTASPGIFSAVMIGFGRAVGETMIVLMATGNTPVMNGSIFSGFRALSANVAVELPEAPENGTLFRVLFLAALLLYVMTFVVNTAAEVVRLRLRRKYRVFE